MKLINHILLFNLFLMMSCTSLAQKQTYDVVSYSLPAGWKKEIKENGVQLYTGDDKTGEYALALIIKSTASNADAHVNFNNDWEKLVKGTVSVAEAPTMTEPSNEKGWDILSGQAYYTDGSNKGLVTLITATGNGKMASVVIMTNTQKYQADLETFLNTLELNETASTQNNNTKTDVTAPTGSNPSSIVGLWVRYTIETNGYYNGFPVPSGGYFRKEYTFYADGTYLYRVKNWGVYVKDILYVYESGTWSTNGNQLTITPKQGKGGWWSKAASGRTSEWGSLVKSSTWKSESVTYTYELHYYSGSNETNLLLKSNTQTEREGKQENNTATYSPRALDQSLIDNPPGLKTGFENKSLTSANTTPTSSKPSANANNSLLAGKTWEAQSLEKYGSSYGSMSSLYTGGFWLYQYKFYADGTYRFVYNAASGLATQPVNVLQYETGTYAINGNQLTITPVKGANEEWSTGKINNGMSAEHIREVLETRIKRLKTTARKLEKVTYPFTIEFWQGNNANALCLKHVQNTVREGSPGQNDQSCFFETMTTKAKNFTNVFK